MSVRRVQCQQAIVLDGPTDSIQMFPPGHHHIVAMDAVTKEPLPVDVDITPETATVIEACRRRYTAAAAAGKGDLPFFDFAHKGEAASAWPTKIYWAGDDPVSGGVRAMVDWSGSGKRAVEGRDFARFSAAFDVDTKTGRVTGAPVNMGGLVNRAAFRSIAPVAVAATTTDPHPAAQEGAPGNSTPQEQPTMPDPKKVRPVIAAEPPQEEAPPAAAENPPAEPASHAEEKPLSPDEVRKMREELVEARMTIEQLYAKISALESERAANVASEAKAAVEAAAADGRIAPAAKERWVQAITANPESRKLLEDLPKHPATQQVIASGAAAPEAPKGPQPKGIARVQAAFAAKKKS